MNMQRYASGMSSAWSYHEVASSPRMLAAFAARQYREFNGNGRDPLRFRRSSSAQTIRAFQSCKIHETYNDHD